VSASGHRTAGGQAEAARRLVDADGNRLDVVAVPPGELAVRDRASVTSISSRPRPATELEQVVARRPSRYCPSDRLLDTARRFADPAAAPIERVRAAVHHVNTTLSYVPDASGPHTDAIETLDGRTGVCRDYAHAVVALCRALDVPARVAAVYAPGLSPMDFHLVAETVLDGVWYVWDATRLAPRPTMIRIGTGRDAADVSFCTNIGGSLRLDHVTVGAVSRTDLPVDDHTGLVTLP
jgi:transglutaminase-like putative cysteine protease